MVLHLGNIRRLCAVRVDQISLCAPRRQMLRDSHVAMIPSEMQRPPVAPVGLADLGPGRNQVRCDRHMAARRGEMERPRAAAVGRANLRSPRRQMLRDRHMGLARSRGGM